MVGFQTPQKNYKDVGMASGVPSFMWNFNARSLQKSKKIMGPLAHHILARHQNQSRRLASTCCKHRPTKTKSREICVAKTTKKAFENGRLEQSKITSRLEDSHLPLHFDR